jgi:hypothetical protein
MNKSLNNRVWSDKQTFFKKCDLKTWGFCLFFIVDDFIGFKTKNFTIFRAHFLKNGLY